MKKRKVSKVKNPRINPTPSLRSPHLAPVRRLSKIQDTAGGGGKWRKREKAGKRGGSLLKNFKKLNQTNGAPKGTHK